MRNYTDEFEQFWKGFPARWNKERGTYIKRKKGPAFVSWLKLQPDERAKCLRIVKKIKGAEGGATRDCVTWLNQDGWDDIDEPDLEAQSLPQELIPRFKTVSISRINTNNERNRHMNKLKGGGTIAQGQKEGG